MDPIEYLSLAKELNTGTIQSPAVESKIRTSISRAYYFILLRIQLSLQSLGAQFIEGKDTHEQVIQCLYRDPSTFVVAQKLKALRKKRNDADYKLHLPGYDSVYGPNKAQTAIIEAEDLSSSYDTIDKTAISQKINTQSP